MFSVGIKREYWEEMGKGYGNVTVSSQVKHIHFRFLRENKNKFWASVC